MGRLHVAAMPWFRTIMSEKRRLMSLRYLTEGMNGDVDGDVATVGTPISRRPAGDIVFVEVPDTGADSARAAMRLSWNRSNPPNSRERCLFARRRRCDEGNGQLEGRSRARHSAPKRRWFFADAGDKSQARRPEG